MRFDIFNNNFKITDMMQKSLFDYLKTAFEGRCNIVRIQSDLSQENRFSKNSKMYFFISCVALTLVFLIGMIGSSKHAKK